MNGKGEIVICLTVLLNIAHNVAIAQGQPIDEEALARRVVEIGKDYWSFYVLPENARERLLEGGIALEQAKEMLKGIIHKNLLVLEKMRKDGTYWDEDTYSSSYQATGDRVRCAILMLREFPAPDTLALLREYALSGEDYARSSTVHTYIAIAGGDSVPFLQEILAKKIIGNSWLAQDLRLVIRDLKKKGRDGDVEKFHIFMLEQVQTEQGWTGACELDRALCATLDGYAQSIQREQAIQRFPERENNRMARQRYQELQADVDKPPASERTDLSKRFKLAEPKTGD